MATCKPFAIPVPEDIGSFLEWVGRLLGQHHGSLTGDSLSGTFAVPASIFGTIEGTYTISGSSASIQITRRPVFLTCGTIENYIKGHLAMPAAGDFGDA